MTTKNHNTKYPDIFNNIDNLLLAESKSEYQTSSTQPFYYNSDRRIKLFNADSLYLLKKIPDNCIDMIFADPPYFGNQSGLVIKRTDGHTDTFDTQKAQWAYSKSLNFQFKFHHTWLKEAQRILKKGCTIWITGTYHSIGVVNVVLQDLRYKILNDIILHKRNAPPNFKGSCFRAVTETMLWAKKDKTGKTRFNYRMMKQINGGTQMKNLWEYWAEKNPFRHPATKQPIILEHAILAGSHENDLVLDPFAGSGTTGYVAQALNRKSILVEIETDYCNLITDRIEGKYGEYQRKTKAENDVS